MYVFVLEGTSILAKEISVAKPTKILEGIVSLLTISVHHIYGAHSPSELIVAPALARGDLGVQVSVRPSINIYPGCLVSATSLTVLYRPP